MQYVRDGAIRKVEKILSKGLDPNFNESEKNGFHYFFETILDNSYILYYDYNVYGDKK